MDFKRLKPTSEKSQIQITKKTASGVSSKVKYVTMLCVCFHHKPGCSSQDSSKGRKNNCAGALTET